MKIALLALLALWGCNINPPHFVGEEHSRRGSSGTKPAWADQALVFKEGWVYVTGVATRLDTREEARRAAEGDARNRLATSIEARISAEFEHINRTRLEGGGPEGKRVRDTHEVETRIRSSARAVLPDTKPVAEYHESYNLFVVGGWREHYDYWVLIRLPETIYRKKLAEARARLADKKEN